ncbi:MAG: hypothetical protein ACK5G9_09565 [Akkermansiaceae bacterium]|jgi:hypothetical protein
MNKKLTKPKIYVELTAVWGNDDADSTIKVSRGLWKKIQDGAEYVASAWSWYEGRRSSVCWHFSDAKVSIYGDDGMECTIELPVMELIIEITPSVTAGNIQNTSKTPSSNSLAEISMASEESGDSPE